MPLRPQLAAEGMVIHLKIETVAILVMGVATFLVALLQLVVKLIELNRK